MFLSLLIIIVALALGVFWGAGENRCWKEAGESVILNNFKLYHLSMATLFGSFNAFCVIIIYTIPVETPIFNLQAFFSWLWLMLWDTWILDVVWWIIRYQDITHLGQTMFSITFFVWEWSINYPALNEYDNGQGKSWHSREDWDNCPIYIIRFNPLRFEKIKLPLFFGVYWWWWLFLFILIGLGLVILYV